MCLFFLFKQKTSYAMRIIDWSSDVCSSDLVSLQAALINSIIAVALGVPAGIALARRKGSWTGDRKSVVQGKRVSVRVDLGGGRLIKKKTSGLTAQQEDIT